MSKPKRKRVIVESVHFDGSTTFLVADQAEALDWMRWLGPERPLGQVIATIPRGAELSEVARLLIRGQRLAQSRGAARAPRPKLEVKASSLREKYLDLKKRNPSIGEEKAAELLGVSRKRIRAAQGKSY